MSDTSVVIDKELYTYLTSLSSAYDDMGIYPKTVIFLNGKRKKRTKKQEGWNDCLSKIGKRLHTFEEFLKGVNDDVYQLIVSDQISIHYNKNKVYMSINCGDLFYWGCADSEEIEMSDISEFQKALEESPEYGAQLWVCRRRKMRPQTPYYKYFSDEEKELFNECGPVRDDECL